MISTYLAEAALVLQILGAGMALVRDYREFRDGRERRKEEDAREKDSRGE